MKSRSTGPALGGVQERWADYPIEDLYTWIRASASMVQAGHPPAVEIFNEWNKVPMNPFPNLTDDQITNMLAYIDGVYTGVYGVTAESEDIAVSDEPAGTSMWLYLGLLAVLAILALILTRLVGRLQNVAAGTPEKAYSFIDVLTSKGMVTFLIFALVLLAGYTTIHNGIELGRQQGYAPEQPIKFSHETHAGLHQIDCQYCHDGARRSKHSVIPAANTCMNCHKAIKYGSTYGSAEITKIYAAAGYDPNTDTYIENYDQLEESELETIYKKWIADQYIFNNEDVEELDSEGERIIKEQWDNLKSSLTNDTKTKIQGPIEWIRIHNLPDHVYFNHSQHVMVGEVECQTCHGKVEEMEIVGQYAPLSMGWCIQCHRETDVESFGR